MTITELQQKLKGEVRNADFPSAVATLSALSQLEPDNVDYSLLGAELASNAGLKEQAGKFYAHAAEVYASSESVAQAVLMIKKYQQIFPDGRLLCRKVFRCCRNFSRDQDLCSALLHKQDHACAALRDHDFFSILNEQCFTELLQVVHVQEYEGGEKIAAQHDAATNLFLVAEGGVQPQIISEGVTRSLPTMQKGALCGEVPFLTGVKERTADLYAVGDTTLVEVPYSSLQHLLEKYPEIRSELDKLYNHHVLERHLALVPFFSVFSKSDLARIQPQIKTHHIKAGELLYTQGDEQHLGLYCIRSGWLSVNVNIKKREHLVYTAKNGNVVGEGGVIENQRLFTVRAISDATLLYWPEADFRRFYDENDSLREKIKLRMIEFHQAIERLRKGEKSNIKVESINPQLLLQNIYGK